MKWFSLTLLGSWTVMALFSPSGLTLILTPIWKAGVVLPAASLHGWAAGFLLLAVGITVVAVCAYVSVSRFGAPVELWYVVAALSVLLLATLALRTAPSLLMNLGPEPMITPSEILGRGFGQSLFVYQWLFIAAVIGYPFAAWIGCALGRRSRELTSAA